MNLKQLTYLCEIVHHSLNMSRAADALHTSQPGLSRQIQLLEDELGITLFERRRNRTLGLTAAGAQILRVAEQTLENIETIKRIALDAKDEGTGRLRVVTTHLHARHTLIGPVEAFTKTYPGVPVQLVAVTNPETIPKLLQNDEADLGVSTEIGAPQPGVTMCTGAAMRRSLIYPLDHPLGDKRNVSLRDVASYPLLGFSASSRSGQLIEAMLNSLQPATQPLFLARLTDTDVIKAYVAKGLGVSIVPTIAIDDADAESIGSRDVSRFFPPSFLAVSLKEGAFVRRYVQDFVDLVLAGPTSTN